MSTHSTSALPTGSVPTVPLPTYPPSVADFTPPMLHHPYFRFADQHALPSAHPAGFDPVVAWWLAESALLTYADPAFATPRFAAAGFTRVTHLHHALTGTQGYVAFDGQHTLVAFRGTEIRPRVDDFLNVFKDVLTDIFFPLIPFSLSTSGLILTSPATRAEGVHAGFHLAAQAIWPQLIQTLQTLWQGNVAPGPLWVTGHSLGGALAGVATLHLQKVGYPVTAMYSFAAPRIGTAAYTQACTCPAYRVMLADDLVPDLPPLPSYYALGKLQRFSRTGQRIDSAAVDPEGRNAAKDRVRRCILDMAAAAIDPNTDLIELPFLADHSPLHYALIMARQL